MESVLVNKYLDPNQSQTITLKDVRKTQLKKYTFLIFFTMKRKLSKKKYNFRGTYFSNLDI